MSDFVQATGTNTVSSAVGTKRKVCLEISGKASRGVIETSFEE